MSCRFPAIDGKRLKSQEQPLKGKWRSRRLAASLKRYPDTNRVGTQVSVQRTDANLGHPTGPLEAVKARRFKDPSGFVGESWLEDANMWMTDRAERSVRASKMRWMVTAAVVAAVLLVCVAVPGVRAQSDSELPAGPMQAKASTACTECHEARIIVQQRLSKAAWTKEVDKMVKWGALVDAQDRDGLIDYLSANFGADKGPYVAERTAVAGAKKQKK